MKKELYKFIKQTIIIFSVFGISYLFLIILWGMISPSFMKDNISSPGYGFLKTRLQEARITRDVDILFLGSSRAYRHYDTRIFNENGFKTFNLGSSAQTFLQTEIILKRYFPKLNPKYIILDIYPGMFSSDGVESSIDLIANDYNDWDNFALNLEHLNIKVFNSWIYSLYQQNLNSSLTIKEPLKRGSSKYIKGGYVERNGPKGIERPNDTIPFELNRTQIKAFLRTIDYLRNRGIEPLLLQSPRHSKLIYSQEGKMDSLLKVKNIKYINLSYMPLLNDTINFSDPLHLNQSGVKIFNSEVISNILQDEIN